MKLEVGKYYKGQNGDKWKCVHDFDYGAYPFICVCDNRGTPVVARFSHGGSQDTLSSPNPLISEWVEPVEHEVEVWFYKSKDGVVSQNSGCFSPYKINPPIAKIKVKFTEGEGL
jgi:hypothetical protein